MAGGDRSGRFPCPWQARGTWAVRENARKAVDALRRGVVEYSSVG
ncbi:hypothetical protein ACFV90_39040 [Streptomyces sp. NPDC059904]